MTTNNKNNTLPTTMRAAQATDYGDIDQVLSVKDGIPVPSLSNLPQKGLLLGPYGPFMLVKVLAVSLSPGDWRTLSGKTRNMQGPPSFPYIPGGDICGIVVELPPENTTDIPFAVGDRIAARFTGNGPKGALGDYALVDVSMAEKVPQSLSSDEAAALASASYCLPLADRILQGGKHERVLVFGARGGLGSHVCQLIRNSQQQGESCYIVAVSSCSEQRLLTEAPTSYDAVIDYTENDVFAFEAFQKDPFDVIVDLSGGAWLRLVQGAQAQEDLIVKTASEGGRYITTLQDHYVIEVSSMLDFLWQGIHPAVARAVWSRTWTRSTLPTYTLAVLGPDERAIVTKTLELAKDEKLKAVIDERGPFPFTTQGVQDAFRLQQSRHVHGKVVIHVADPD